MSDKTYTCRDCGVECLKCGCSQHPNAGSMEYPARPARAPAADGVGGRFLAIVPGDILEVVAGCKGLAVPLSRGDRVEVDAVKPPPQAQAHGRLALRVQRLSPVTDKFVSVWVRYAAWLARPEFHANDGNPLHRVTLRLHATGSKPESRLSRDLRLLMADEPKPARAGVAEGEPAPLKVCLFPHHGVTYMVRIWAQGARRDGVLLDFQRGGERVEGAPELVAAAMLSMLDAASPPVYAGSNPRRA